jgi:hypothetical protein
VAISATNDCCGFSIDVVAVRVRLESLRFGGNNHHNVARDTTGQPYAPGTTPHWQYGEAAQAEVCNRDPSCCGDDWYWDDNCYQIAIDLGSTRHPVAYRRNSEVRIQEVRFRIEPDDLDVVEALAAGLSSIGVAPGFNLVHDSGVIWKNSEPIVFPNLTDMIWLYHDVWPLPPQFPAFAIDWPTSVTIATNDGDVVLDCFSNTSKNTLYVTLENPTVSPLFHTVVHRACKHAAGQDTQQGAIDGIWSYIQGMVVRNYEEEPPEGFGYWRTPNPPGPSCVSTQCLLNDPFDGQCGAWARFMRDLLKAHSIPATVNEIIPDTVAIPSQVPNPDGGADLPVWGYPGFDIKYTLYPNAPWDPGLVHPNAPAGIRGQGDVLNPESRFAHHAVVVFGNAIYDASYGRQYESASAELALRLWQVDAAAAIAVVVDRPDHGWVYYYLLNEGEAWNRLVKWGQIEE